MADYRAQRLARIRADYERFTAQCNPMTENNITPPPELVQEWASESLATQNLCNRAAAWGADQQLEKDAEWLDANALFTDHLTITPSGDALRQVMRPKPPSLKEQALEALAHILNNSSTQLGADTIRRALEQLPE